MPKEGIYDVHCHIIPGVDDGASDYEETKRLLQMEYDQGVRGIIVTPHFRFQMFETPIEHIKEQFVLVQRAAAEIGDDLNVYLGCEFHVNMEMPEMLRAGKVSTMAGSRYVLTEFSESSEASYIRERIYALLSNGYKPVIAHIERYEATRSDLNFVEELDDMGACMQINADSIIGNRFIWYFNKENNYDKRINFEVDLTKTQSEVDKEEAKKEKKNSLLIPVLIGALLAYVIIIFIIVTKKRKNEG